MSVIPNPLADKVRAAHPGVYDDLADDELSRRVVAKYPQYQDLAPGAAPKPPNVKPEYVNPLPTDNIPIAGPMIQPFGEVAANLQHDPEFRNETGKNMALSAAAVGGGAGLAATAPAAIPPIASAAHAFMGDHPILSMAALEAAKEVPVIGKYARHIPSWLPLLAGGKGVAAPAEAAEAEAVAPAAEAAAAPRPTIAPPSYPPDRIGGPVIQRGPIPGSRADLAESKGIQESIRDAVEGEDRTMFSQEKRDWFARNVPGSTKGELTEQFKKTKPTVRISSPVGTPATDDLTPILQQSLEAAKKARLAKRAD